MSEVEEARSRLSEAEDQFEAAVHVHLQRLSETRQAFEAAKDRREQARQALGFAAIRERKTRT
jgi:hypothetical protein